MDKNERNIRFDIALEMVQAVFNDYCHDETVTREHAYEFGCFVCEMINFSSILKKEAIEELKQVHIDLSLTDKIRAANEKQKVLTTRQERGNNHSYNHR